MAAAVSGFKSNRKVYNIHWSMIITNIVGGLGNQMFQYAVGKALAIQHNTSLKLDTSSFSSQQLRNFDLAQLQTTIELASDEEINALKIVNRTQRIFSLIKPYSKRKFYKEPYFHFDPQFFNLGDTVYLKGYFQSERYFKNIETELRSEFRVKPQHIEKVKAFSNELKGINSVAIHIRRGDYTSQDTFDYHGILPLSYYKSAIEYLQGRHQNLSFFIFSNDPKWVTENLDIPNATIVSGNISSTHFEDLHLMSQCRYNIIANSSFSWWSAWLNDYEHKTVIAPERWFNNGPKDLQDLLPKDWIRL